MVDNLMTIIYMLIMLAIVISVNTILGVIIANKNKKFDWKKLVKGISKALVITLCMVLFCFTLELVPVILARIGVEVANELITVAEVVLITLTAYKKYAFDCLDKFKEIIGIEEEN